MTPPKKQAMKKRAPLRENVVAFIVNKQNKVLLMKRKGQRAHWQLPQGGVDKGETKRNAVLREAKEEVGLAPLHIVGVVINFHSYEWPKGFKYAIKPYRGQLQTLFFLRYDGKESDVKIDEREASAYQWIPLSQVERTVAPVRRPMVKKAIDFYGDCFM